MPRQRVEKLGSVGMNTDIMPTLLPPEAWTYCYNVQTVDGSIGSINGELKLFNLAIKPLYHFSFIVGITQRLIISDGFRVYAYDTAGTAVDISPSESDDWSGGFVSFCALNGVLVVNSATDGPFYWDGSTRLAALPGWDSGWTCREMCAFRYYLVALNMIESGTQYPHKIRWSSSAADGEIPTEWAPDPANDAGDDILGETMGVIVCGRLVRDALIVVKEDSLFSVNWIGGDYILQASRLMGSTGTRNQRGAVELRGNLLVLDRNDLQVYDGNSMRSMVDGIVRRLLTDQQSDELWELSQLYVHGPTSKLFVAFAGSGSGALSSAATFDINEQTWGLRRLSNGLGFEAMNFSLSSGTVTWDELGPVGGLSAIPSPHMQKGLTWDEQRVTAWNQGVFEASSEDLLLFESNAEDTAWWVSAIGRKAGNSDGSNKFCQVIRTGIPIEGCDGIGMVREIWPEMEANIPLQIKVGAQCSANGDIYWGEPEIFVPGQDCGVTPRITGRFICLDISSDGDGWWKLGSLTIDWERAGER